MKSFKLTIMAAAVVFALGSAFTAKKPTLTGEICYRDANGFHLKTGTGTCRAAFIYYCTYTYTGTGTAGSDQDVAHYSPSGIGGNWVPTF